MAGDQNPLEAFFPVWAFFRYGSFRRIVSYLIKKFRPQSNGRCNDIEQFQPEKTY